MAHNMEDCPYRDKIEELDDKVSNNEYRINMIENGDWYSNKELHEMIDSVRFQLKRFDEQFETINNSLKKIHNHEKRIKKIEEKQKKEIEVKQTKSNIYNNWKEWLGWIIATILGISKLLGVLL